MVPLGAGVNGFLRWKELGLDTLLPVDEEAEKKTQAEQARKMANGAPAHQQPTGPQPGGVRQQTVETQTDEEGDEEDTEGDDDDEEEQEEELATEVDEDESSRIDSQDLLSSDY